MGILTLTIAGCGEEETRTLEPETPDGNLDVRDGQLENQVNLDPGPAVDEDIESD